MRRILLTAILSLACGQGIAQPQERSIDLYFANDSINGFQYSDAYETHDMGLRFRWGRRYADLNLALVSPDMWIYKNQFRTANRSFGEIITATYGFDANHPSLGPFTVSARVRSAGEFGLERMQDWMHDILNLQPVGDLEARVRMPDQTWFGVGFTSRIEQAVLQSDLNLRGYWGTDRASVAAGLEYSSGRWTFGSGIEAILYDDIVSAPPILATHRKFIPQFYAEREFEIYGRTFTVREHLSLPTISSDDGVFAVLSVNLTLPIK
jgi:hypothetical protein